MPTSEQPPISVVIRAYNEAEKLQKLLLSIEAQEYSGTVQLIVVDNGSTDTTATVAKEHGATVVTLPQEQFSYPLSLNLGFAQAQQEIVFSLSAHCILRGNHYFASAVPYFDQAATAGVTGITLPNHPYTVTEFFTGYFGYLFSKLSGTHSYSEVRMGILQNVCSALRLSLWKIHPFDEAWGAGGEDYEWARWALQGNYKIYLEPNMAVYHSHQLGFSAYRKQHAHWRKLTQPHAFNAAEISFRKDITRP